MLLKYYKVKNKAFWLSQCFLSDWVFWEIPNLAFIVAEIPNSEGPNPQSLSTEKKTHWIIVQVEILARAISP